MRAWLGGASLAAAAALSGCPVDDRTLLLGAGGNTVTTVSGGDSSGGTAAGSDSNPGGAGSSAGSLGDGGDAGASVTGGTNGVGGTNGTGGTGGALDCRGSRCSCFGDLGNECAGGNCCRSQNLPNGSFVLGGGGASSVSATLEGFGLDRFEVTVGRFRRFVDGYLGPPQPEAGQHPWVVASGWQSPWDAFIATDARAMKRELACDDALETWTDEAGANETRPINCVTWFEAFAFCAWDGGRLPTEAEWEYAASGGEMGNDFPWGDEAPSRDRALYECGGRPIAQCSASDLLTVGSKPEGVGRFGNHDLAGSVTEWLLDWHAPYTEPCENCATIDSGTERVMRGGSFLSTMTSDLAATSRARLSPNERAAASGFRCARDD